MSPRTSILGSFHRHVARRATAVVVGLAVPALVIALPNPAAAAPNLVTNPSVELDDDGDGVPDGYMTGGYGANTVSWSRTGDAHSGSVGARVEVSSYTDGDRKLLAPVAGDALTRGRRYTLEVAYEANAPVWLVVLLRTGSGAPVYWRTGPMGQPSWSWQTLSYTTPPLPGGVSELSFGLALKSTGSLITDDYSAIDAGARSRGTNAGQDGDSGFFLAPAVSGLTGARLAGATAPVLFRDDFNRSDRIETNEYAFWNGTLPPSVISPNWEMGSGTLFVRDGAGYTGHPDAVSPDAASSNGTHSAIFRLKTRRSDFGDALVSLRLQTLGLTGTPETPPTSWDGVHVWLRYQSERQLYDVSVNRRDGAVMIKKKVSGGESNGGTYYDVASGWLRPAYGQWIDVSTTVTTNADGSVTIRLYTNGDLVLEGTDHDVGGVPPITRPGAVGLRGDNAEFLFDDLTVRALRPTGPDSPRRNEDFRNG